MSLSAAKNEATPTLVAFPLACSHPENEPTLQPAEGVFRLGYRRWLDGLRGLAILLVMAYHLGLLSGGFLGVDIFFVLSGFLITSLLMEEWQTRGSIHLKRFYLRRALRLLPAFALVLLFCGLSILWLPSAEARNARWREVAVAACYLSNWPMLHQTDMPILRHTWSLSVEEQFYLLWPLLLYAMLRFGLSRRRILVLLCCGVAGSAVLRLLLYRWYKSQSLDPFTMQSRLYMGLDTRADALLVGCLLGVLAAWDLLPRSRRLMRCLAAASLLGAVYLGYLLCSRRPEHPQLYKGLFTAISLMTAIILARLLAGPGNIARCILEFGPLVGTGRISYALYLFHMPLIYIFVPVGLYWSYSALVVLVVGLSFFAAVLSYYLLERPCLRLKDRLQPPRAVAHLRVLHFTESGRVTGSIQSAA